MAVLEQLQKLSDERFLAIYTSLGQQGFGVTNAPAGPVELSAISTTSSITDASTAKEAARWLLVP